VKILVGLALISLAAILGASHRPAADLAPGAASPEPLESSVASGNPVLVELFTSEGCSSCPPADELLAKLQQQPVAGAEIITLSEHVDYWNHLGWADPFSSAQFSARQSDYAHRFGARDIYTPQMVVDGRKEFVGNDLATARQAIAEAARRPKAAITVRVAAPETHPDLSAVQLVVRIDNPGPASVNGQLDVVLAIAESGLRSSVQRGENKGRKLIHTSVVRSLQTIGSFDSKAATVLDTNPLIKLETSWNRSHLRAVVFAQNRNNLQVAGAASTGLY
jgi:hypothetical protein